MKIVILNGSPKGMTSVTMQYILFLKKKLPQHEFLIRNVCQDIRNSKTTRRRSKRSSVRWQHPMGYCGRFRSITCWFTPITSDSSN